MSINPFIELARDPVAFFGWLGWVALLLVLVIPGTLYVVRAYTKLYVTAQRPHRRRDWWGDAMDGWVPPAAWSVRALWSTGLLIIDMWALAALIWFLQ